MRAAPSGSWTLSSTCRAFPPPCPHAMAPALQWTLLPVSGHGEGCPGCRVTGQEGPPGSRKLGTSDEACSGDPITHGLCHRGLGPCGQRRRANPAGGRQTLSPGGRWPGPQVRWPPQAPGPAQPSPCVASNSSPLGAGTWFAARRGVRMGSGPRGGRGRGHRGLGDLASASASALERLWA